MKAPFCSVIIPTIGRSTLARAVASVEAQAFASNDLEIIIVNDSGEPLPPGTWDSARPRVITTMRRERCVARNTGAAAARGQYLCFLDDDDWLLPGALGHFKRVADESPEAVWLYGGLHVVDAESNILGEAVGELQGNAFAQVLGGAWVPLQASLIRADAFFAAGGFDAAICGTEDLDLTRRVAFRGDLASTPAPVACLLRGPSWQTSTDYGRAAEDTRRSRDRLLNMPGAFGRIRESLRHSSDSGYWYGRMARVAWSAANLNFRQGRLLTSASRTLQAVAAAVAVGPALVGSGFWQGFAADHVPGSLHFIIQALERKGVSA